MFKDPDPEEIREMNLSELQEELQHTLENMRVYLEDSKMYSATMNLRYMGVLYDLINNKVKHLQKIIDNYKSLEQPEDL